MYTNPYEYRAKTKILFICKGKHLYGKSTQQKLSTGLCTSAQLVVDMLKAHYIDAAMVNVVDNNDIDREVTKYKPTVVIIEALWVVPEKFRELIALHPRVIWLIRLHSEIPFLAAEGSAFQFIQGYLNIPQVFIGSNSDRMVVDLKTFLNKHKIVYLPNYYPLTVVSKPKPMAPHYGRIDIGCFGSLRLLKNQLESAVGAVNFGNRVDRAINFHINVDRQEGEGSSSILKNLRSFFDSMPDHNLVEHPWLDNDQFLKLVKRMDIGMQISFSETFNLVTADFVSQMVPVVVSEEVRWLPIIFHVDPNSTAAITDRLYDIWNKRFIMPFIAYQALRESNERSVAAWTALLDMRALQHGHKWHL